MARRNFPARTYSSFAFSREEYTEATRVFIICNWLSGLKLPESNLKDGAWGCSFAYWWASNWVPPRDGRQIGCARLDINREQVVTDRRGGMSLTQVAKRHSISRVSVCRLMKEFNGHSPSAAAVVSGDNRGTSRSGRLLTMTDERVVKSFVVVFTNGDLPNNPMSLRECVVCGA
jgi:hypothetical protein